MPLVAASWRNNRSFGCSRDSVQSVGSLPSIEEDDERYSFDDSESDCEDGDAWDIYEALNSIYEQRTVEAVCGEATLPQSHACSIPSADVATPSVALEDDSSRNSSRNNSPVRAPEKRIDGRRIPVSSSMLTDEDLVSADRDICHHVNCVGEGRSDDILVQCKNLQYPCTADPAP